MIILAQLSSTPAEVAVWLGGLAAVTVVANQVLKLTDRFKEQPPPAQTYVSKGECSEARAAEMRRLAELEARLEGERAARDGSLRRVHERIDVMVAVMNQRFDAIPGQVIKLLNETGAIGRKHE